MQVRGEGARGIGDRVGLVGSAAAGDDLGVDLGIPDLSTNVQLYVVP